MTVDKLNNYRAKAYASNYSSQRLTSECLAKFDEQNSLSMGFNQCEFTTINRRKTWRAKHSK